MPEFDRWVQRYVRRISVGEFLRDAAEWLAGFCFVFGVAVLAVKLRWPNLWPHVLWLVAASIPVTGVSWWLSRRRRLSRQDAVAMLDQKLAAGGLLMTLSELPGPAWKARLPQLESLWRRALPTLRPVRFTRVLVLPIVFAVATCFVPLRDIHEPVVEGAVAQQTMQRLEEFLAQLEEAEVIKPEEKESEQLKEEMQKLSNETKERPLTHEKWETVDALQERLKAKLERQASLMTQAADSLAALNKALDQLSESGETKLSDEQMQQLEKEVAKAMQELAKSGSFGKLSPALQQKLGQMAKAGQFKLPQDPAERETLAEELQKFLEKERQKLTELRKNCEACQGKCDKEGECEGNVFSLTKGEKRDGRPGRGGVSEGRGDADLEFGDMSNSQGTKFKETILPPGYLDKPRDEILSVTGSVPEVKPAESAPRNAARPNEAASGNEAWNRNVRPRHRNAVKNYFSEK